MKNYLLIPVCLIGMLITAKAQNNIADTVKQFNIVYLPNYYKEEGVIFSRDYVVGIDIKRLKSRYTPTIDDITKVEDIFNKKYNEVQKTNVETKYYFCHWVRQYVGLIDSNGNKNIIVQLIDNKKSRKLNRRLGKHWETDFVIYFSDPYPSLGILFKINIDKCEMTTEL